MLLHIPSRGEVPAVFSAALDFILYELLLSIYLSLPSFLPSFRLLPLTFCELPSPLFYLLSSVSSTLFSFFNLLSSVSSPLSSVLFLLLGDTHSERARPLLSRTGAPALCIPHERTLSQLRAGYDRLHGVGLAEGGE